MNDLDLFTPTGYNEIVKEKERKETLKESINSKLKGGVGSGNFGHAGRPGKVGGSSKRQGLSREADISKNTANLLSVIQKNPDGFSHKPKDGSPSSGYMVAIEGHELIIDANTLTKDSLRDYVAKSYDIMKANKRLYFGGWLNTETGQYVLDLSENYQSLKVAWNLAKQRKTSDGGADQVAIFDLNTFNEVPVRGHDSPPNEYKKIYDESPESED